MGTGSTKAFFCLLLRVPCAHPTKRTFLISRPGHQSCPPNRSSPFPPGKKDVVGMLVVVGVVFSSVLVLLLDVSCSRGGGCLSESVTAAQCNKSRCYARAAATGTRRCQHGQKCRRRALTQEGQLISNSCESSIGRR